MNLHRPAASIDWQVPASIELPKKGEIHLWRFRLDQPPASFGPNNNWLNQEEQARAAAFKFPHHRKRWTHSRAYLRHTLGQYLGLRPAEVQFKITEFGKPFLPELHWLTFNLSHSDEWAVLACTDGCDIGVDVEFQDESWKVESLVERFFSPVEVKYILNLDSNLRHQAFFRAWTRKEAIIKAEGSGLYLPLNEFGVRIGLKEEVSIRHMDWAEKEEINRWSLFSFETAMGYPAAVAVRDRFSASALIFYRPA